nr:transmembrane protein 192 isoform X3 [Saimiri boliviensis boliviensis]
MFPLRQRRSRQWVLKGNSVIVTKEEGRDAMWAKTYSTGGNIVNNGNEKIIWIQESSFPHLHLQMGSLDITQSIEDDPLLDAQLLPHHSLQAHFRPQFHPLPTVIIVNLLWFIHLVFVVLAFLTGVLCSYPNPHEDKCPGNYTNPLKVQTVIILGKVILWILHLLLECYIQYHHSKVRNRGYNLIYRSTRHLKRLALMIHSSGNTVLLLILCMQHSFPEPGRLYLDLILALLALELICSLMCLLIYTGLFQA